MTSTSKKRKVDKEFRIFNEEWRGFFEEWRLFTEVNGKCICLLCKDTVAVRKEYNVRRHYDAQHAKPTKMCLSQKRKQ